MRARNIKPDFFRDYELCELDIYARVLFAGLWCLADREGRLEDCSPRIRADVFPYDNVDVEKLLESLSTHKFIVRYQDKTGKFGNKSFIQIPHFTKHQNPHKNEKPSELPSVEECLVITGNNQVITGGNRADSLTPDSLIPEYKTLYIEAIKNFHRECFGAVLLKKEQLDIFKSWFDQGKIINEIKLAYQKTANAKPATRWKWIVEIIDGKDKQNGHGTHGGQQPVKGKTQKSSMFDIPTGPDTKYDEGF